MLYMCVFNFRWRYINNKISNYYQFYFIINIIRRMSSQDAKRALEACERGVNELIATSKANQAIVDTFNHDTLPQYNSLHDQWKRDKERRIREQQDWDRRRDELMRNKEGERRTTGEGINPQAHWCTNDFGTDWEAEGRMANWANVGRMSCKKTEGTRRREAENEAGNRPGDFNQQEPQRPERPAQNESDISISCCANLTQIVASNIDDSVIQQSNDCKSSLQGQYEDAVKKEEEERKRKEEDERKRKEDEERKRKEEENRKKTMRNVGIGAIIIIVSCCFLFVLLGGVGVISLSSNSDDTDEYSEFMDTATATTAPISATTATTTSMIPTTYQQPLPPPYVPPENENGGFFSSLF